MNSPMIARGSPIKKSATAAPTTIANMQYPPTSFSCTLTQHLVEQKKRKPRLAIMLVPRGAREHRKLSAASGREIKRGYRIGCAPWKRYRCEIRPQSTWPSADERPKLSVVERSRYDALR
jgi:hypothetical protein